jgi:hypothetical protein
MSQTAVLESVNKTDQEFKGMSLYEIKFRDDQTPYITWRSPEYPITFNPGDNVNFEVTGEDKKDPAKKKIKFLKSNASSSSAPRNGYTPNKTSAPRRSADTNRAIMSQTCLKAAVDFFKDRQNSSLEDVSNGTRYLLAELESILDDSSASTSKPAIPKDFLDRLPNQ